jgi:hypothetical protein
MHKRLFPAVFLLVFITMGNIAAQTRVPLFSPLISKLKAETRDKLIRLSWEDSGDAQGPVYVFRSSKPFTESVPPDITPIEIAYGTQSYTDEVKSAGTFYYFIAASDFMGQRHDLVVPEVNVIKVVFSGEKTASAPSAESVPAAGTGDRNVRSLPLPVIAMNNTAKGGAFGGDSFSDLREPVPLGEETSRALAGMRRQADPLPEKKPRAFTRDLEAPSGDEESELRRIVQGPFTKRDWQASGDELRRFLSLPRHANTRARARFYLGQSYYFTGKYREALLEFLFVRSLHPNEANVWIEAALAALVR